jgi:zinc protease
MRSLARLLVAAAVLAVAAPAALAADPTVPAPVTRSLPNGLQVAVFADHRLPLVQVQLLLPAGSAQDRAGSAGSAWAAAQLLRSGTSSRTPFAFAADLDQLGGSLSSFVLRDYSMVSGTFLAADLDAGLELLADAVVNPMFPPEEVDRLRVFAGRALLQSQQDPASQADAALWATAFAGHPYATDPVGTPESMERLDAAAIRAFHHEIYRPDHAVLAVAGDVDPERVFALAADRFGSWAGRAVLSPALAAPVPPGAPVVHVEDRSGVPWCEVRVGLVCPPRASPDAVPVEVALRVLVGGPDSRLARAAREGRLAFDVGGGVTFLRDAGLATLSAATRADSVAALVTALRAALAELRAHPPAGEELAAAQRFLAGRRDLALQGTAATMGQWLMARAEGLPDGALQSAPAEIAQVTPARVAEAAARWLDPAQVIVVAVGPGADLAAALAPLGLAPGAAGRTVEPVPAPATAAAPSAEEARRGRALLAQAVTAHGGLPRLRRVRDSIVSGDLLLQLEGNQMQVKVQQVRREPMRLRYSTRKGDVENGQVLDGDRGWLFAQFGDSLRVTDADPAGIAAMQAAFRADVVHTLLAATDSSGTLAWRGTGKVDGRDADRVEVTMRVGPGRPPERHVLYLDAKDHRLIAEENVPAPGDRVPVVRKVYRDFRPVNGVVWPFYEERLIAGTRTMTLAAEEVRIDSGVLEGLFRRPEAPAGDRPLR